MWETLLPTIVGGIIGLVGSVLAVLYQYKMTREGWRHERNVRLAENRENLYLKLAGAIDDIHISIDSSTGKIDVNELERDLQRFADVVEENKAAMALYGNREISNDLLMLNSRILNIIEDESLQEIDYSSRESIESSPVFEVTKQAKLILIKMRKDLVA